MYCRDHVRAIGKVQADGLVSTTDVTAGHTAVQGRGAGSLEERSGPRTDQTSTALSAQKERRTVCKKEVVEVPLLGGKNDVCSVRYSCEREPFINSKETGAEHICTFTSTTMLSLTETETANLGSPSFSW